MEENTPMYDPFLEGNDVIENAISRYYSESSRDSLTGVLESIRQRMHADGHFVFPVLVDEEDPTLFSFRSISTKDGKLWNAAFTSQVEFEKGAPSQVISNFIDSMLKSCLETEAEGFIINPWGQSFMLSKELIEIIFNMDGDVEYSVPDDPITPELLEGGTFLKRAISICNRNRTQLNLIKLVRILRDSWVWIPCNTIMSDADINMWEKAVAAAQEKGDLSSLVGQEFVNQDEVRLVPDILQNENEFFFPVFTSTEEMGEYGNGFSKIEKHFLEAATLAKNSKYDVTGIVINAFSDPFVIPKDMFDLIDGMPSSIEEQYADDVKGDLENGE